MFYLIGIVITFFLVAILAGKKGKTAADRILTFWLIAMGVHLLAFYFFVTGQNRSVPYLLGLELPLPLVHGPFLYLYTRAVTGRTAKRGWLHFIPVLVAYLLLTEFLLLSPEEKIQVYEAKGKGFETNVSINIALIILSGIVYFFLSLRVLHRHTKNLQNQFSSTEKISLSWLRYLIYGIGLIWLSVMFGNETTTFGLTVVFVIFIGYFGINQVGIFTPQSPAISVELEEPVDVKANPESIAAPPPLYNSVNVATKDEPKKAKYLKSSLNEVAAESIHQSLTQAMRDRKLFTNSELTLAELAEALAVHPNNLSQVINTYEQKSFYDYINLMRVDEFKRLASLPENQKFTLLGLAQNCGFNSKTSFNRNFKNATGLSPTEYLKQANILIEQ
jgi:AraC-like DNA-binding protein